MVTNLEMTLRERVGNLCVAVHEQAVLVTERFFMECRRRHYTTPSTYSEFLRNVSQVVSEKIDSTNAEIRRFDGGVQKLKEAAAIVESLRQQLNAMQPQLEKEAQHTGSSDSPRVLGPF